MLIFVSSDGWWYILLEFRKQDIYIKTSSLLSIKKEAQNIYHIIVITICIYTSLSY